MMKNQFNILFTSSGRRVSLIKHFKSLLNELNLNGKIITADLKKTSPTGFISDEHVLVPRVTTEEYIPSLLQICKEKNISLIVPLIDTELVILAKNKERFKEIGAQVLVCSNDVNEICFDKRRTASFFREFKIDSPIEYEIDHVLNIGKMCTSLLIKPAKGSSSVGVNIINSIEELEFFSKYLEEPILQELVFGEEYTIDVLVDFNGDIITAVPRLRMETRAGEVSKGMTVRNSILINKAIDLVKKLPGAVGCITVQCFLTPENEVKFIEINPRFGGGFPLSLKAGADFPRYIIESILDIKSDFNVNNWTDGLVMLRYDDAVFVSKDQIHD
ncbi:carbamoyl-phosphate synthase large subunit [Paenisporosarcina quisquiliarum]|nr:carbamoyl-phosphate synthase large subunit [Paenisporosarcina quisquiliarum]